MAHLSGRDEWFEIVAEVTTTPGDEQNRETGRQGDRGTRGENSPCLPFPLSPCLPVLLLPSRSQRLQARGNILRQFGRREAGGDLPYFAVGELSVTCLMCDDVSPR